MAASCDRMGIDIWDVVDVAYTRPFGFMRFEPGPGTGGHCLPVDPFYLSWCARQFDMETAFIELAGMVNPTNALPLRFEGRAVLNASGKLVKGSKIVGLGVGYKAGVGDTRESAALKVLTLLGALGAELHYHDPFVPSLPKHGLQREALADVLIRVDIAVIVTARPGVDHDAAAASLLWAAVDLRGVTRAGRRQAVLL